MDERTLARARSFGRNAELYDRSRPSYPPELIEELLAPGPTDLLDVGCGTAKAARLLMGPGRHLVGVEPDPLMAAVARDHGVNVEVATFETWDAAGRRFDLVTAAQSWHWVDPVAGAARVAEVLRPGGRFAAFWNSMHHSPEVLAVLDPVYARHAPDLIGTSLALGAEATLDGRSDPAAAAFAAGPFTGVTAGRRTTYHWRLEYTPSEWVDLLRTHSDHSQLAGGPLDALLAEVFAGLSALGPSFIVEYRTDLLTTTRT
jgi:SAM-dependent methyltransferase